MSKSKREGKRERERERDDVTLRLLEEIVGQKMSDKMNGGGCAKAK